MLRAILNNPLLLALGAVALLVAGLLVFLEGQTLIVSTNAVRLVVAAAVGIAWLPAALLYIFHGGRIIRRGYLIIGICGSWMSDALIGALVVLRRYFAPERPWWLGDEAIVVLIFIAIACGILHLTAGSMEAGEDHVPTRGWVTAGVVVGVGIALAVLLGFVVENVSVAAV